MSQPPPSPPTRQPDRAASNTPQAAKREMGDLGAPQAVFDTVTGPNLRLRDNLIQLASVVVAVILGILIAFLFTREPAVAIALGLLGGLIGGILISGAALGIYRFITGIKRMQKK